jgi:hypothetical protein
MSPAIPTSLVGICTPRMTRSCDGGGGGMGSGVTATSCARHPLCRVSVAAAAAHVHGTSRTPP